MPKNAKSILYIASDFAAFVVSYLLAYLIAAAAAGMGEGQAQGGASVFADTWPRAIFLLAAVKAAAFFAASVYRIALSYASAGDYRRILLSSCAATGMAATAAALLGIWPALASALIVLPFAFDIVFVFALRMLWIYRSVPGRDPGGGRRGAERAGTGGAGVLAGGAGVATDIGGPALGGADTGAAGEKAPMRLRGRRPAERHAARSVMVVGSAKAAADLIEEMQGDESLRMRPVLAAVDDEGLDGAQILGVETFFWKNNFRTAARKKQVDEILVSDPGGPRRRVAAMLREALKTKARVRMVLARQGHQAEGAEERVHVSDMTAPQMTDFFGRERPSIHHKEVGEQIRGSVALVTGGGGVFGAELCRQILRYKPRRLVAVDMDEDSLALLLSELGQQGSEPREPGDPEFRTVVANVRDAVTMRRVFSAFRPHLVFHAAELKQIPSAQGNPRESVLTNILGAQICADLADEFAVQKFILVSTVRARVPGNVAAATKRAAELFVIEKGARSKCIYAAVRFPNLIEAHGNVIEAFARQIAAGGPVTVTEKDLVREFVSAEETALLTLQAAALAEGGEIYQIGPGERIGIHEVAEAMIRISGKVPYEDIGIVITQLRPGERLYEEAVGGGGQIEPVSDRLWRVAGGEPETPLHLPELWNRDAERIDDAAAVALLQRIFPVHGGSALSAARKTTRGKPLHGDDGA